jgi:hypothetical protein
MTYVLPGTVGDYRKCENRIGAESTVIRPGSRGENTIRTKYDYGYER